VGAESHRGVVAIEEGRVDALGEHRGDEERVLLQRSEDHASQLARRKARRRKLEVPLHLRRLRTGGGTAVLPLGGGEHAPALSNLIGVENIRDVHEHRGDSGDQNRTVAVSDAERPAAGTA
jgi:hypothetical protein